MQDYFFFSLDKRKFLTKISRHKLAHILDQQHFLRKIADKQRLHENILRDRQYYIVTKIYQYLFFTQQKVYKMEALFFHH